MLGLPGADNLASGFNDNPRWVPSTVAGRTYTGSIWVKPQVGQLINLRLREWRGSTPVTDRRCTLTASGTAWQRLTVQITTAQTGNQLSVAVYETDIDAGESFLVDDLSLTSP